MIFVIKVKMAQPKTKGRMSKKARLSKYRRKSANAKERERMKKQNDVFEVTRSSPFKKKLIFDYMKYEHNVTELWQVLKQILPIDKAKKKEEDKETKVKIVKIP